MAPKQTSNVTPTNKTQITPIEGCNNEQGLVIRMFNSVHKMTGRVLCVFSNNVIVEVRLMYNEWYIKPN